LKYDSLKPQVSEYLDWTAALNRINFYLVNSISAVRCQTIEHFEGTEDTEEFLELKSLVSNLVSVILVTYDPIIRLLPISNKKISNYNKTSTSCQQKKNPITPSYLVIYPAVGNL
jgi:hypothetical protein